MCILTGKLDREMLSSWTLKHYLIIEALGSTLTKS